MQIRVQAHLGIYLDTNSESKKLNRIFFVKK